MRIEPNRKITVCMCVFVPLFFCVFVFSGSLTTGPDVEFSPSGSVVFACSPFLSNHRFASAVNKRVGKSICTHACTYVSLCSWLDAAFLNLPHLYDPKAKENIAHGPGLIVYSPFLSPMIGPRHTLLQTETTERSHSFPHLAVC